MYPHQSHKLQQFLRNVRQFVAVVPRYNASKNKSITNDDNVESTRPLGARFFAENIGSTYSKWIAILGKHPELKTLKSKDVVNTGRALKELNFSVEDVLTKPMILYLNETTIENRYNVLKECGVEQVTMSLLSKFVAAMNRNVVSLKTLGHLPYNLNVAECLRACFTDIEVEIKTQYPCNEDLKLKILRTHVLNYYLQQRLDLSYSDLEKLWKVYGRLRHRNFGSVQKMVKILLEDLEFSKDRIFKNAFLLYGDPNNVKRIIHEIPTIDGLAIKEIFRRRPKIMMSACDALLTTMQHVKNFGIGEDAILRCLEILTLGPDTVLERLKDLNEIEEFQVLSTNPRVLRLVHYQNKARLRLDYLNHLKVRCASLHILSCGSVAFTKFAREGSDRTKGRDIVVFLSNIMNKSESDLRNLLSRHPNWCHIPVTHVKQCYEYLLSKRFNIEDIYKNIHLLLYPIKRIEEKLCQLNSSDLVEEFQLGNGVRRLSDNEILTMILYLIESEFHFTGDGIWTDQHIQHVENFNNLLPDFPESLNKMYSYGVKHPATTTGRIKVVNSSTKYVLN